MYITDQLSPLTCSSPKCKLGTKLYVSAGVCREWVGNEYLWFHTICWRELTKEEIAKFIANKQAERKKNGN